MGFLSDSEREVGGAVRALATGNPFLPERITNERTALGDRFVGDTAVWHEGTDLDRANPNVECLAELVERLAPTLRERLARKAEASPADGGTTMRATPRRRATPWAWTGPAPPNATRVWRAGSWPRSAAWMRAAFAMFSSTTEWMPSAASSTEARRTISSA